MKYRKKSVEVEAMEFTDESKDKVLCWCKEFQYNIQPSFGDDGNPILIIPTLEGDMLAEFGDYVVKEPFPTDWRKFYPCKKEIFEMTYDKVTGEVADDLIELAEACKAAVEYMQNHHCPHDTLIITQTHAEIVSGQKCVQFSK